MNFVHKWPKRSSAPGGDARTAAVGAELAPGEFGDWALTSVVLGDLWWTTLHLGGYPPDGWPVMAALSGVAVVLWLARAAWTGRGLRLRWEFLAFLPFLAYAAINARWISPVPWLGWRDWLGWAQMAAVFAVVSQGIRCERPRQALFWGVAGLGVVAVAMAAYQRLGHPQWLMAGRVQAAQFFDRSSGPFGIPNSLAAFLDLLLPPLIALTLRPRAKAATRVLCGYLAALFACGLILTLSRGAWLALGGALVAWPVLALRDPGRRWRTALGVAGALAVAAAAIYWRDTGAQQRVDLLLRHPVEPSRAVMWRAAWQLFLERPLTGSGAGSFSVLFEGHRPERFWDLPQWAHNDYLNTLSDYGAIGFLLCFGGLAVAAWRGWIGLRSPASSADAGAEPLDPNARALRMGLAVGLLAFALQLVVDFNLKIPALAQAAAVLAGLALAPVAEGEVGGPRAAIRLPRWVAAVAALAVVVALPGRLLPMCRAEARRYQARRELDWLALHPPDAAGSERTLAGARDRLEQAVRLDPHNASAWSDLADTLVREAGIRPAQSAALGTAAEADASRAIAESRVVADFWVHRGMARDLQGRWRDAWADYVEALRLAPHRSDIWYCYAYHLSLCDLDSARAALATCLRLDPWNGPALALRKHLGASH